MCVDVCVAAVFNKNFKFDIWMNKKWMLNTTLESIFLSNLHIWVASWLLVTCIILNSCIWINQTVHQFKYFTHLHLIRFWLLNFKSSRLSMYTNWYLSVSLFSICICYFPDSCYNWNVKSNIFSLFWSDIDRYQNVACQLMDIYKKSTVQKIHFQFFYPS